MAVVVWLDSDAVGERTGGKGASLIALGRAGFPVPSGFVVTADGYEQFAREHELQPEIDRLLATPDLRLPKVARDATTTLRERLATATLPVELAAQINAAYTKLRAGDGAAVAARSSGLSEDGSAASSAGLYESYLNLTDQPAVLAGVLNCYRSLWSARAVQYRAAQGISGHGEAMAVVVMAMVPAECAGVAFTANPVTGDRDQIIINASWGLGEAIVAGRVSPDSFIVAKDSLQVVQRDIYPKEVEIVADPTGGNGTLLRSIDGPRTIMPALNDADLDALVRLCLAIEAQYGEPMDIEWALAGSALFVLQARPITGLR